MEFSHDGRKLATCGKDTDVLIYDTSVFQELYRLRDHTEPVAYITWSPDDANLITCSFDRTARIWDADVRLLAIAKEVQPLADTRSAVRAMYNAN